MEKKIQQTTEELKTKLKSPLDFKKIKDPKVLKIIKIAALIIVGIILIFVITMGVGIYAFGWNDNFTKTVTKYIPYPAALVGGNSVRLSEYFEEIYHAKTYFKKSGIEPIKDYQKVILDRLINRTIIQKLAKDYNIQVTPEEIDAQFKQEADAQGGEDKLAEILLELYDYNIKDFKKLIKYKLLEDRLKEKAPVRLHVQHILVKAAKNADAKTVASAKAKADELYQKVTSGKEDFGAIAKEFSEDDASKNNGGDLGFFSLGQLVKEFEDAALATKVGQISKPVRTNFGFHIIKVLERKGDVEKNFDDWFAGVKKNTKTLKFIKIK